MSQTGISLNSAILAGVTAKQITDMNTAIGRLNSIVAGPPGSPIVVNIVLRIPGTDTDLMQNVTVNAADSSTIINQIFIAFQTLLAQYNAALANMPIT